ncbi:MAG: hypothetical protein ABSE71_00400 [Candidatus Micrarchaeaceae archaeon]|jgi:tetratricopeptide (TPR) repeat protein|nr:hypothetical protein [Candidatus Micrarchaeota archaeon]HII09616.1 hypothetical protein [Candidatus Micrarchaeota archaeon]
MSHSTAKLLKAHEHMRNMEYAAAFVLYRELANQNTQNSVAYYHCGNALASIGKNECVRMAISSYEYALRISPNYAAAHFKKGLELLFSLEREEDAFCAAERAAGLSPNDPRPIILISLINFRRGRSAQVEQGLMKISALPGKENDPFIDKLRKEIFLSDDVRVNTMQMRNLVRLMRLSDYIIYPESGK